MPSPRQRLASFARKLRQGAQDRDPRRSEAAELTALLRTLTSQRQHAEAVAVAREALAAHPDDLALVKQVRVSATKAGEITLLHDGTVAQLKRWPTDDLAAREREQRGRLRETDPQWSPTITDAPAPVTDPVPGRIVHLLKISMPHRQSGYSVRTMYTLTGQLEAGLDPVGVTALDFPRSIGAEDAPAEEVVGGVRHRRIYRDEIPQKEAPDAYLDAFASEFAQVVAQERPELIHVHSGHRGFETARVALAVGKALGVPVVYEVRGFFEALWTSDYRWAEEAETYRRRYEIERYCMTEADAVVTLSESMRQDIVARGVAPEQVFVVPNGVNTEGFSPRERRADLVESLGLADRFVFGYVSNLDHWREGHELLIEAAQILSERGIPATALIVGDGSRREELEALTDERNARDVVVFTGRVPHDEVLDYYALYDAFVVPRVDERAARLVTPLKPFEAMAAQIPVVVSSLPALTEITGEGAWGASFEAGSAAALADVLEELQRSPERRAELAAAGREWVLAERQWSSNAARYDAVYDAVRAGRAQA